MQCMISRFSALSVITLYKTADNGKNAKTKCRVVVISSAEAFLCLILTLMLYNYCADNLYETYNYVLNGSLLRWGNHLNLKGFLFNL